MSIEEDLARKHAGYTWTEYVALPGADWWIDDSTPQDSKSRVLAAYRAYQYIEAVKADASLPEVKKGGKPTRSRR